MPFGQAMRGAMGMGGGGGQMSPGVAHPSSQFMQQRGQMGAMFGQNPGMGGGMQSPRPGNPYGQPQANTPFGGGMRQGPMAPRGRFGQQMGMLPQFMQQRMGQMGGQQRFVDGPGPRPDGYGQQQQPPAPPQDMQGQDQAAQEMQNQMGQMQKPAMQGGEAPPWMQSMQGGMGPQQSKLQQMMQRFQQRPQPAMVNNGWGKMIPREQAEAFRLGGGVA